MAISVDWPSKVIFVPKADTTLLQVSPEVRALDVQTFRLALKDLEDGEEGVTFPDTHKHTAESVLSGIVYARVIEIINGYTVEFEDGAYAVTILGANTNLLDVKVPNSVSLLGNNSAGLVNLNPILSQLIYQGIVWVDTVSGTPGTIVGTHGVPSNPVNNLPDAVTIANALGVKRLQLLDGSLVLDRTFTSWQFQGALGTHLDFNGQNVNRSEFSTLTVHGALTGTPLLSLCSVGTVSGFSGEMTQCGLSGTVGIAGFTAMHDCHSDIPGASRPAIDFESNPDSQLSLRAYSGGLNIRNFDNPLHVASLDINTGSVELEPTVTAGAIVMRGIVGGFINGAGPGVSITQTGRVDPLAAQTSSFDGVVHVNSSSGAPGTNYPTGLRNSPVNNTTDALAIAANYGLSGLHFDTPMSLTSGVFATLQMRGDTPLLHSLTLDPAAVFTGAVFKQLTILGTCAQPAEWFECRIETFTMTGGVMRNCALSGNLTLQGPYDVSLIQCAETEPGLTEVILDCGGGAFTGQLGMHDFFGALTIRNKTGAQGYQIDISSGTITIDATVTAGTIRITGQGVLIDNSGPGATIDSTGFNPGSTGGGTDIAGVQTALTLQGYTTIRAMFLDQLDSGLPNSMVSLVQQLKNSCDALLQASSQTIPLPFGAYAPRTVLGPDDAVPSPATPGQGTPQTAPTTAGVPTSLPANTIFMPKQPLLGVRDGVNKVFTTVVPFVSGDVVREVVYRSGVRVPVTDYRVNTAERSITFLRAPQPTDTLFLDAYVETA